MRRTRARLSGYYIYIQLDGIGLVKLSMPGQLELFAPEPRPKVLYTSRYIYSDDRGKGKFLEKILGHEATRNNRIHPSPSPARSTSRVGYIAGGAHLSQTFELACIPPLRTFSLGSSCFTPPALLLLPGWGSPPPIRHLFPPFLRTLFCHLSAFLYFTRSFVKVSRPHFAYSLEHFNSLILAQTVGSTVRIPKDRYIAKRLTRCRLASGKLCLPFLLQFIANGGHAEFLH